jgi:hypothetical protein
LQFSGERPSFCAYCGNPLNVTPTAAFEPTAETKVLHEPPPGGPAAAPAHLGGYRILRPLGAGGMGAVYEAEDVGSGRRVALKLIAPEFTASASAVDRFRQEGRLASGIAHPRCVFVVAADEDAGRPYIVMELMPGDTLETLVARRGPLPPEQAVAKILDVIDGLREAHRLGVIHRDVKPSNCFLEADGRVKVGDFGLAKSLVNQAHLTKTGTFLGTLLFCSPEQIRAEPVDQQSDVYSVAATLYYLLTGKAPFQGGDAAATLARIVADPAPSMRSPRPDLPAALDQVVLRGLERDRPRRWRSLEEFRAALLPFAPGRLPVTGVGLRFGAYLIDSLILMPLGFVQAALTMQDLSGTTNLALLRVSSLADLFLVLAYYALQEGLWGCTLGKRLLRLRVWTVAGSGPPGLPRALLRTGLWLALISVPTLAVAISMAPSELTHNPQLNFLLSGLQTALLTAGVLLMVSTMRARNGYRCLHDVLSGTRVVRLPDPERRRSLTSRPLDRDLRPGDGLPGRLGGFVVRGVLGGPAGEPVLLGEDQGLGREVLLWLRPADAPPLGPARRELTRLTRLRWLAGGRQDDRQWDAFLAPAGRPLAEMVGAGGPLPWAEARPLLEQLTEELAAARAGGTLPGSLVPEQVWVQANGQALLLDMALCQVAPDAGEGRAAPESDEDALALLGRVAGLLLEGHPRPAGPPVRAPVPGHAADFLARLLGRPRPYRAVAEARDALAATRDRPAEVTRARRAAYLALQTLFLGIGLSFMAMAGCMSSFIVPVVGIMNTASLDLARHDLEEGAWREFVVTSASPAPPARFAALAQLDADLRLARRLEQRRQRTGQEYQARLRAMSWPVRWYTGLMEQQMRPEFSATLAREHDSRVPTLARTFRSDARYEADTPDPLNHPAVRAIQIAYLVFWPPLWVAWAFLARGGISRRLAGLALVRADGRHAARWQCAWRALLVWAPVTALLVLALWLDGRYWATWEPSESSPWVPWLTQALWWGGWGLLALEVVLALRQPARAPHDRLAGTYLVPR